MKYLGKITHRLAPLLVTGLAALLFLAACENQAPPKKAAGEQMRAVPVEVATIEHGPITLLRTFNGSLEPRAEFQVAPKISGRIKHLTVNLADTVTRGQVVAELDDEEYIQAVARAGADLAVAKANLMEAKSALDIAEREFERQKTLKKRGIASEAQFDEAMAALSSKQAGLEVAKAGVAKAGAQLETDKIRLGYTKVTADWSGGGDRRVVAQRHVDAGHTVAANAPLLLIVELDPITGIIFVTERDYSRLHTGQSVRLATDAHPGEIFNGRIARIAPIFSRDTRQARVELTIDNPDANLKPGMFIRATVELASLPNATIVPEAALTSRNDQTGVFLVNEEEMTVSWQPVRAGIRQDDRVQIEAGSLRNGRVVSLGHQLVDNGSRIMIANETADKPDNEAANEAANVPANVPPNKPANETEQGKDTP